MLSSDRQSIHELLELAKTEAIEFLNGIDSQKVAHQVPLIDVMPLPENGLGAEKALALFKDKYNRYVSGSAGPRYFGFVTGGATPASLVGDWLTATYDQNLSDAGESYARQLTLECCQLLRDLLDIDSSFHGTMVSGATTSSLVALSTARQWVGRKMGIDLAVDGVAALGSTLKVFSGTPHSSIYKVLSVLGIGRKALEIIPSIENREAIDIEALERRLKKHASECQAPPIVVANAGTVNTCDFDNIEAITALKETYSFWLHVDAAFGGFANASPKYSHYLQGWNSADSITIDGHKWLNVPYDSAFVFSRHQPLQGEVFNSMAAYLPAAVEHDTFIHLTPENSQRTRALPAWMSLTAYGKNGYQEIIENCCELAHSFEKLIQGSSSFKTLSKVNLNGVCFTLLDERGEESDQTVINRFLDYIRADGRTFLTPSVLAGKPCVRISITNWRTRQEDIVIAWQAMCDAYEALRR